MANPDILRAFDMLAGAASDELRKSREFKINQNQRLQALAQMQQQQDREFKIEKGKLDVMREELNLRKQKQQFEQSGDLAERDSKIGELKRQNDYLKTQGDLLKLKNEINGAGMQSLLDGEERLVKAFEAGLPEDVLDQMQQYVSFLAKKNLGIDYMTQDVDYTAARNAAEQPKPINPLSPEGTDLTFKFMDRAKDFSKDYEVVQRNLATIEATTDRLLNDPSSKSDIATSQAIITAFNKMLDPGSVVRESEFARTPQGAPLIEKFRSYARRIEKGGILSESQYEEIRNTARQIAEIGRNLINDKLESQVRKPAAARGLNVDEIAPLYEPIFNQEKQQKTGGNFQSINADTTKQPTFNTQDYVNSLGF